MADAQTVQKMFASIAARYDITNSVLSFGIHHFWRKALIRMLPPSDSSVVLDLCTGTGDLLPLLRERFGNVVGADFCFPMLAQARNSKKGGSQFSLINGDALNLPFANHSFDIVSVAFGVRNFENLVSGLTEIRRVLKPNGKLLVLEFGQPSNIVLAQGYRFYSNWLMPLIGGAITGNRKAYQYLPKTAGEFPCADKFTEILESCGFSGSHYRSLSGGIAFAYMASS